MVSIVELWNKGGRGTSFYGLFLSSFLEDYDLAGNEKDMGD